MLEKMPMWIQKKYVESWTAEVILAINKIQAVRLLAEIVDWPRKASSTYDFYSDFASGK